jgi:hypothetical protein
MEWLQQLLNKEILVLLIPIVAIVGAFVIAAMKAHHRHQERIEQIKQGFDPDR